MTVSNYLAKVYPTAASRYEMGESATSSALFDGLHFYYDHGCDQLAKCGPPGVMLRNLYRRLLPCRINLDQPPPHSCLARHAAFSPPWVQRLLAQGWAEVEHRAFGIPLPLRGKLAPTSASDFMDSGAASMWYVYRRGSGIFYKLGRVKAAPGKNVMLASLLLEAAANESAAANLDLSWRAVVTRAGLFDPALPTAGLNQDASRIVAAAAGTSSCAELGLRACRCFYVLGDEWDDALIWLARKLRYDTLFFSATLLGRGYNCSTPDQTIFDTAYPEFVDLRVLAPRWTVEQEHGVHRYLQNDTNFTHVHRWRKKKLLAERWVEQIRGSDVLSMRDPENLEDEASAKPCNFSVTERTLRCEGHVSAEWPWAPWWRMCGIVMCGYTMGGWVALPWGNGSVG
tara:strand:+ start:239 stop:1435 length:1197 start_codon:yes stop_codon:yes gene_type:complete